MSVSVIIHSLTSYLLSSIVSLTPLHSYSTSYSQLLQNTLTHTLPREAS